MTTPKRQPEPLDPIVAVSLFVLLVVIVGAVVGAILASSWQLLVIGAGLAVIIFGYICLANNQRQGKPRG